jgi:hypothetical protein
MLLAQREQPLLQRPRLPVDVRPMPRAGEPAREKQQHRQDETHRRSAGHDPALVTRECHPEERELLALSILDDEHAESGHHCSGEDAHEECDHSTHRRRLASSTLVWTMSQVHETCDPRPRPATIHGTKSRARQSATRRKATSRIRATSGRWVSGRPQPSGIQPDARDPDAVSAGPSSTAPHCTAASRHGLPTGLRPRGAAWLADPEVLAGPITQANGRALQTILLELLIGPLCLSVGPPGAVAQRVSGMPSGPVLALLLWC